LNCEWYGDASVPSPFAELKRNVVSDLIMSVARAHAPFVAIALNPEAARTGDFSGILAFHSTLLENRVQRLRSGETPVIRAARGRFRRNRRYSRATTNATIEVSGPCARKSFDDYDKH